MGTVIHEGLRIVGCDGVDLAQEEKQSRDESEGGHILPQFGHV